MQVPSTIKKICFSIDILGRCTECIAVTDCISAYITKRESEFIDLTLGYHSTYADLFKCRQTGVSWNTDVYDFLKCVNIGSGKTLKLSNGTVQITQGEKYIRMDLPVFEQVLRHIQRIILRRTDIESLLLKEPVLTCKLYDLWIDYMADIYILISKRSGDQLTSEEVTLFWNWKKVFLLDASLEGQNFAKKYPTSESRLRSLDTQSYDRVSYFRAERLRQYKYDKVLFAYNGFHAYEYGRNDTADVICGYCGLILNVQEENPAEVHRLKSSYCPFVRGL